MLSKINRIKKNNDFEDIFKKGVSFKNNLFILKILKNTLSQARVGFVVSQKVSKKATIRNKVKRRLSEIVRSEFENIENSLDLVIICLPGSEKKEFSELKNSLINLLVKAKIISNSPNNYK